MSTLCVIDRCQMDVIQFDTTFGAKVILMEIFIKCYLNGTTR